MDFQTTPIQRDFYIEELFNSDSNSDVNIQKKSKKEHQLTDKTKRTSKRK